MGKLIFDADDVKRVVEHSLASPKQRPQSYTTIPALAPSIILVHDDGVYLMSNGDPGDPRDAEAEAARANGAKHWKHFVAYARGCNPHLDVDDWYDNAHRLVGGDDFAETLPWANEIAQVMKATKVRQVIITMTKHDMSLSFSPTIWRSTVR